jgi:hypothetical protein
MQKKIYINTFFLFCIALLSVYIKGMGAPRAIRKKRHEISITQSNNTRLKKLGRMNFERKVSEKELYKDLQLIENDIEHALSGQFTPIYGTTMELCHLKEIKKLSLQKVSQSFRERLDKAYLQSCNKILCNIQRKALGHLEQGNIKSFSKTFKEIDPIKKTMCEMLINNQYEAAIHSIAKEISSNLDAAHDALAAKKKGVRRSLFPL